VLSEARGKEFHMVRGEPIRILMAEDNDGDRQLTQRALADAKLRNTLEVVTDGEALLAHLRGAAALPDLVLLDLYMPRMDGREALTAMRADSALRDIPVVVLTGSSVEDDERLMRELGVLAYLHKPVTFGKLLQCVSALPTCRVEISCHAGARQP
jgi:two-component system, response regulator